MANRKKGKKGAKPVATSRQSDLKHVEERIKTLGAEAQLLQERYQAYHNDVQEKIKTLMVKAGVWEKVNKLELERAEARKKAEEKLRGIVAEQTDFQKFRNFLLGREDGDVAEAPEPNLETEEEEVDEVELTVVGEDVADDEEDEDDDPVPPEF